MRKAVCFGITEHTSSDLNPVAHCEADVNELAKIFRSNAGQYHVTTHLNKTSNELLKIIWQEIKNLSKNDQLVLFFSGHGLRNSSRRLQLCTTDTIPDCLIPTSVSFDQIISLIKEFRIGAVLIILDCCFSGSADKSILNKGGEELFTEYEQEVEKSKGLSVLTSSHAAEPSFAINDCSVSTFTYHLIQACENLTGARSGWVPVSDVFSLLQKSYPQKSCLIGENPVFPLFYGKVESHVPEKKQFSFSTIKPHVNTFVGLLLLPVYRAYIIALSDSFVIPQEFTRISHNVFVLFNTEEAFVAKVSKAKADIASTGDKLLQLSYWLGQRILVLYPISVHDLTYERFNGTDKKYIFKNFAFLPAKTFLKTQQNHLTGISLKREKFVIQSLPQDYSKENFGISFDRGQDNNEILIAEESFLRNSKFLLVKLQTHEILYYSTIGQELRVKPTHDKSYDDRINWRVQRKRTGIGGLDKPRIVMMGRQLGEEKPFCETCLDMRFVIALVGTRRYKIPCKDCNSDFNSSWKAFPRDIWDSASNQPENQ